MNRLDTAKLDIPQVRVRTAMRLVWGTYLLALAAILGAIGFGSTIGENPTDQVLAGLARLPIVLLLVDFWSVVVAILRRHASTPLRVPLKTPAALVAVHLVLGVWADHLVNFDVLYKLVWISDQVGNYEVRWGIAATVVVLSAVSLLLAGFEIRLVRWVLLSEMTAVGQMASPETPQEAEDMELGTEHLYEAQVLLNNLGYEVSAITGELNDSTVESLKQFQSSVSLEPEGKLTAKSMIELRNRWRDREEEGSPALAVSEHAVRKTGLRLASFFKRS